MARLALVIVLVTLSTLVLVLQSARGDESPKEPEPEAEVEAEAEQGSDEQEDDGGDDYEVEERERKKRKRKRRDYENIPLSEKEMFGSKSLRCLVCKALVEEFEYAVRSADPKRKIESGSFRLRPDGQRDVRIVSDDE